MLPRERAARFIQEIDYRFILPGMSRLPLAAGQALALLRGRLVYCFDYDWRNQASGVKYIRNSTLEGMGDICPDKDAKEWYELTKDRFVHHSREEWQAGLFSRKVMDKIFNKSSIEGLQSLQNIQAQNRGVVLVSCHLDSFCMGMVLLGMQGLRTNCVNTAKIEDSAIHPAVRAFFQKKYRSMERLMKGYMKYYQTDMAYFYKALTRGEIVVLMGDIPGSKSSVSIPFFGRRFRMPLGAWHMTVKTGSLVGAYVCINQGTGRYRVICLEPFEPDPDSPEKTLRPVYDFLQSWISRMPERWICADLLAGFPKL